MARRLLTAQRRITDRRRAVRGPVKFSRATVEARHGRSRRGVRFDRARLAALGYHL
jgi:hypothetical protein